MISISIITVCYNAEEWISDAVESVLEQSYSKINYYIIDGLSTDRTIDVLHKKLLSLGVRKSATSEKLDHHGLHKLGTFGEKNIYLISEPDNGLYDAMNKGIGFVSEGVVGILNSDDMYRSSQTIENVMDHFKKTNCDALYGNLNFFRNNPECIIRKWRSSGYKKGAFQRGWHPPHPTFFVDKNIYCKYGVFDTTLEVAADFDLMFRFIEINKIRVDFLNETLVLMRYGGKSTGSLKNIIQGQMDIWRSFKKNGVKFPNLYYFKRLLPKLREFRAK